VTDGVHIRDNLSLPANKELELSQNIKLMKPQLVVKMADTFKMDSCMVFCRTNLDCDNFEKYLMALGGGASFRGTTETGKENPYSCVVLAGMRSQEERTKNLEYFKRGDVRFLVCTDVAARGIDIQGLPFLIMTTLPEDTEQFFHRVGRVGRADRMGLAICLVSKAKEKVWYHKCDNRGKGCTNTKLVTQGGCTIWYDEPSFLRAIETRLQQEILVMDSTTFGVPGIIDLAKSHEQKQGRQPEKLGRRSKEATSGENKADLSGSMVLYGKSRDDRTSTTTRQHLESLTGVVAELTELEKASQRMYLTNCKIGNIS